jgi:hypothetical protein
MVILFHQPQVVLEKQKARRKRSFVAVGVVSPLAFKTRLVNCLWPLKELKI